MKFRKRQSVQINLIWIISCLKTLNKLYSFTQDYTITQAWNKDLIAAGLLNVQIFIYNSNKVNVVKTIFSYSTMVKTLNLYLLDQIMMK